MITIPDFYCPKCSYLHSSVTLGMDEKFIEINCFDFACDANLRVTKEGEVSRYVNHICEECEESMTDHYYTRDKKIICPKCHEARKKLDV